MSDLRRVLGLDFGSKTVGVAISDPLLITAQSLETITRESPNKLRRTYARIEEIVAEYDVEKIVVGLPKHMNDSEGERAELTREFAEKLGRRTGLEIIMWDERMTTIMAEKVLQESGVRRENRKTYIDSVAATFILQDYLDYIRKNEE